MENLESMIVMLLDKEGINEEKIFESVNKILLKHGRKKQKKKKRIVCRPVLLISDSSSGEEE